MPATAPLGFRVAAKKKVERPVTEFFIDWVDDEDETKIIRHDVFHAKKPTDEQLFLIAASIGGDDLGSEAAAVLDIFRQTLPPNEVRVLKNRLADPEDSLDLETLSEILEQLMGQWASFPTEPSSASPTSQTSSGTKSKGRVRGQGSISSTSPSTDS